MAEVTPDSVSPDVVGGFGLPYSGAKHLRLHFQTNTFDGGDSYVYEGEGKIVGVAWETAATSFPCSAILAGADPTGKTVLFTSGTTNLIGHLHLWVSN